MRYPVRTAVALLSVAAADVVLVRQLTRFLESSVCADTWGVQNALIGQGPDYLAVWQLQGRCPRLGPGGEVGERSGFVRMNALAMCLGAHGPRADLLVGLED